MKAGERALSFDSKLSNNLALLKIRNFSDLKLERTRYMGSCKILSKHWSQCFRLRVFYCLAAVSRVRVTATTGLFEVCL